MLKTTFVDLMIKVYISIKSVILIQLPDFIIVIIAADLDIRIEKQIIPQEFSRSYLLFST
jgi:hypothetical protein